MSPLIESEKIIIEETERKPNRYAARVVAGIVIVISVVCLLNEIGLFALNKYLVRFCLLYALLTYLFMRMIIQRPSWTINRASKYWVMGFVLLLVLTLSVLLNIHAILALVLPLLLATQYRSFHISRIALGGSILIALIAPILSYLLDTWNIVFMTGYIQAFCRVTIDVTPGNGLSTMQTIFQIFLFWSLPQMLVLLAFGSMLFSITQSGISDITNRVHIVDLSDDLQKQLDSLTSIQEQILFTMSDIIENKDFDTGGHVRRTSEIVRLIMQAMRSDPDNNISDTFFTNVVNSAPMHDLGKISVPDAILTKAGKLTEKEYAIVKLHPEKSAKIISRALTGIENEELINTAINMAKYHHERVDGKGYPEGLNGKNIPLEARIMAIADVYDSLVSERCYKASMSFEEAFNTIQNCMGTQFDPDLNPYFLMCRDQIEAFYRTN